MRAVINIFLDYFYRQTSDQGSLDVSGAGNQKRTFILTTESSFFFVTVIPMT